MAVFNTEGSCVTAKSVNDLSQAHIYFNSAYYILFQLGVFYTVLFTVYIVAKHLFGKLYRINKTQTKCKLKVLSLTHL